MKKVIIVHCWDGYSDYCWYPWAKEQLEKYGFEVMVPNMPDTASPNLSLWLPVLTELANAPTEDLFLVGHSAGCITILRYLETLKGTEKIGGAVLVAPFTDSLGYPELENFFTTPIQFGEIKKHCERFTTIHSDNDPYVPMKFVDIFQKELSAESIVKHSAKHFSGPRDNEESCLSLPEVVATIVQWSSN